MAKSPLRNIDTRFWLRVWPRGDCWEWRGCRTSGYGKFNLGTSFISAHRWAFIVAKGEIPVGLVIDHRCNHPWCVRPSHLIATTNRENVLRGEGITAVNARKTHCM